MQGSKYECAPVGAVYETLCAVMRQVQHVGCLLELLFEFIAVPAAHGVGQRGKRRVVHRQVDAKGVHLTHSGT